MDAWQALSAGMVGLCIGLVLLALVRLPDSHVVRSLLCLVVTVALWSLGELIASGAGDMTQKQVGLALLYTGAIFLPASWWALAVRWSQEVEGRAPLRHPLWVRVPALWACAMWLLMLSNPWHGGFITPVLGDRNLYGTLWWTMAIPNYALILASAGLVVRVSWRVARPAVRWQGAVLVSSSGLTLLSNWAYLLGFEVRPETTLLVFAIAAAILAHGMYRQGLFGVLPAALSVIFEHDRDGLLVVRPGGRLVHCNPKAREILTPAHLTVDARIPQDLPDLIRVANGRARESSAVAPGVRWWSDVLGPPGRRYRYGPDGERFLHISGHAVRGRTRRLEALVLRVREVTAEEKAAVALRRARRLDSVAELARGVAHDFHNLLCVVRGNARMLAHELHGQPKPERRLDRILRFAKRATELADQLELYAGGADPALELVDLNELVRDTADGLEPEPGAQVALHLELDSSELMVLGDATQLRQAILNLLVNAREALAEQGGVIRVSTGTARVDPKVCPGLVHGGDRPAGLYAYLLVTDDGPGIDLETQERIFEPFVSSKGKHRGIGLSTVLGIARVHSALLRLESTPGQGTTFGLYLDLDGADGNHERVSSTSDDAPSPNGRGPVRVDADRTRRDRLLRA